MDSISKKILQLVDDLLAIQAWSGDDLRRFKHLIVQAWTRVHSLIHTQGHLIKLEISTSVFPRFQVYARRDNLAYSEPQHDACTIADLLLFIEHGSGLKTIANRLDEQGLYISRVQLVLAENLAVERSLGRHSHAYITSQLSEVVLDMSGSETTAETELKEYLSQCFLYEASRVKSEASQADYSRFSADPDTERLVLAIDNYTLHLLKGTGPNFENVRYLLPDSVRLLDLQSSDPRFEQLYTVLLQLVLYKSSPDSMEKVSPYVDMMIKFYQEQEKIMSFEKLSDIQRGDHALKFFCGSETGPGIVPVSLREYALEILKSDADIPEISQESEQILFEDLALAQTVSQTFTKAEILTLVADFGTVISTLSEYDPRLDDALSFAFRNYTFVVYKVFPELPVLEDYRFIDSVLTTITAVVDYVSLEGRSESDIISEILFDFHQIQKKMLEVQALLTLLMRLTISETQNSLSFARICLRRWNHRTLISSQLRVIYEEECVPRLEINLLRNAFRNWHRKSTTFGKLHLEAEGYYEKKQLSHFFNTRWIKTVIHVIEMNSKLENVREKKLFNVWSQRLSEHRDMELTLASHFDSSCILKGFRLWLTKHENVKALNKVMVQSRTNIQSGLDDLLRARLWEHWKMKLEKVLVHANQGTITISEKIARLDTVSRQFVLGKYFGVLMTRSAHEKASSVFIQTRNSFLKRHFLGIWKRKKQLLSVQETVATKRAVDLKRSALECWYDQTRSRVSADQTLRRNTLEKYWKFWRNKEVEYLFRQEQAIELKKESFRRWLLRYRSSSMIQRTDTQAARCALLSWIQRAQKVSVDKEIALSSNEKYSTREAMLCWRTRMDCKQEMVVVADLNFQRKFFTKIRDVHLQIQNQQTAANQFSLENGPRLVDRLQLKALLQKWQEAYVSRYEEEASHALTYFRVKVRNAGKLSVFFRMWKRKALQVTRHKDILEKNLRFFNDTNILKSEYLLHWIDVSRANTSAQEKSVDFYRAVLHKKFLLVWYEKHVTKSRYLADIAEDHINRREYNQMLELLRKWSLAFTKNVRRNQQTCDMFVEKWERNNLQSLFELWLFKARKKVSLVDEYTEADTTFGSNTSPLSRKFIGSGAALEYLDGASYLYTPVKKHVPRLPSTPAGYNTSPTRLRETNQKMKSTKMDALTNRYKLAKKSGNKGARTRLFRSESTSLPPPVLSESPSRIPARSPPASRFESCTNRSFGPEATSSPEYSRTGSTERFSPESEDHLLETAKRLQRIKPVAIPPSDSPVEFRYSPISKLREMLHSRANALQHTSDVFDK